MSTDLVQLCKDLLSSNIELSKLILVNDSNDSCTGLKLNILIVSEKFNNVSLLDRHRLVHDILKVYQNEIHSISMKTLTLAEYEKKKSTLQIEFQ